MRNVENRKRAVGSGSQEAVGNLSRREFNGMSGAQELRKRSHIFKVLRSSGRCLRPPFPGGNGQTLAQQVRRGPRINEEVCENDDQGLTQDQKLKTQKLFCKGRLRGLRTRK